MNAANSNEHELQRLRALARYAILDTLPEQDYDDITKLAAQVCDAPIALVSLVDSHRQWCKARLGEASTEVPRSDAFCAQAILAEEVMVVADATQDPRFASSPLVLGEPHMRFYAGAPIVTRDGFALGTVCVLDTKPRRLSETQLACLRALSRQVLAHLELRARLAEQKETCERLDEVRERLDLVVRGSCDGFWDWDVVADTILFSDRCRQLIGEPAADRAVPCEPCRARLHPADADRVLRVVRSHLQDREPFDVEFRYRMPDGGYRWFRSRGVAVWGDDGVATRMAGSLTDVTESRLATEALQRVSELLEESQSMARVGGWQLDVRENQLSWTDETYRIHELAPAEFPPTVEKAIGFYAPESVPVIRRAVELAIAEGRGFSHELQLITAKGRRIWVRASGKAILQDGTPVRILGAFQDITEQKLAAAELRRARDVAEAASRAKSEFLATMSHEIRTPMNGVLGFTGLLLGTPLSDEQRSFTETIERSGQALLALIDDILDFSKIEAGRMELEHAPFDLHTLCGDVLALLQPKAAEKGLQLSLELEHGVPRQLVGDGSRVRQVLLNLAGNALKFTSAGSVRIHVARRAGDEVEIAVADTGIGIPDRKQGQLFEKFVQADSSTRRRFGGTGLGLAISKRLVDLLGGSIGMTSREGAGSTFWFTLPIGSAAAADASAPVACGASAAPTGSAPTIVGRRVLVAEDNAVNQRLAMHVLQRSGCVVDVAGNGAQAVAMAAQRPYDLILMDCLMPDMDGFEATRAIRLGEAGTGRRTPIVALTANAMPGDREACFAAGMDDYVTKPFSLQTLQKAMQRWAGSKPPA